MSNPFIGQIEMFGGNFAPRDWAFCDGTLLPIAQNTALFSILGTTYGGDGRTTFALPELRGRSPVHEGTGTGLSPVRLGARGGTETTTLTVAHLPNHTHTARCVTAGGNANTAPGNRWSSDAGGATATYSTNGADANMAGDALTSVGNGNAFDNRSPYLAVNFIIALRGTFPSRS